MIIVKIELHSALTGKITTMGVLDICNDGSGSQLRGNYNVLKRDKRGRICKRARIENYPRKSRSVFKLVRKAFEALGA